MPGEIELKLRELGLSLPTRPTPIANFLPFRVSGNIVYLAGQTCERDGRVVHTGRVGEELTLETGRAAAQICALNLLSCLRVGGFVQAKHDFARVPAVIDGASELFVALWGDHGRHARTAVGVAALPQNAAVEVDAIFELRGAS